MGTCECGCGGPVNPGRRFIHHHQILTPQARQNNGKSQKRVWDSGQRAVPEPKACRHGCGRLVHPWSLKKHENACVPTYERFLEVLRLREFTNVGEPGKCWISSSGPQCREMIGRRRLAQIACEFKHGPAPADKPYALHSCDVAGCANPDHVHWGTQAENVADMVKRGRGWWMSGEQRVGSDESEDEQPSDHPLLGY